MKMISRSPFEGVGQVIYPLFFATVAFFMFRAGGEPTDARLRVARRGRDGHLVGDEHVRGRRSSASAGTGRSSCSSRRPPTSRSSSCPLAFATSAIGIYCMVATLLWGRFVFGIDIHGRASAAVRRGDPGDGPLDRRARLPSRSRFARYRAAWALGNADRVPGLADLRLPRPAALLPDWVRPISWALAPTWGMRAIRESSTGGSPLPDIGMCVLLGAVYVAIGVFVTERRPARSPPQRQPLADMTSRSGSSSSAGCTAYRALINWLSPWIFVPTPRHRADLPDPALRLHRPKRRRRVGRVLRDRQRGPVRVDPVPLRDDAMRSRASATSRRLTYILVTPAGRLPLFLGRALPVIVNAMFVAAFSLLVSGLILGIDVPVSAWPAIALVIFVVDLLVHRARPDLRGDRAARPRDRRAQQRHLRVAPDLHRRERAHRRAAGLDAGDLGTASRSRTGSRPPAGSPTARRSATSRGLLAAEAADRRRLRVPRLPAAAASWSARAASGPRSEIA